MLWIASAVSAEPLSGGIVYSSRTERGFFYYLFLTISVP